MRNPHRYFGQLLTRRLISLAVAAAFALTILPIPLPVIPQNRDSKDTSQPFPCQNRTCGCCSADQCWKKCCCFTNQQKVSWAEKNGVQLPRFVVDAAREDAQKKSDRELATETKVALEAEICSLTEDLQIETHERACSVHSDQPGAPSNAGQKYARQHLSQEHPLLTWFEELAGVHWHEAKQQWNQFLVAAVQRIGSMSIPRQDSIRTDESSSKENGLVTSDYQLVLIIKALECRGQGSQWIVCAPIAMPSPISVTTPSEGAVTFLFHASERLPVGSLQPPVPPPRIS